MSRWIDVGAIAELKFQPGAAVKVEGIWIGLFEKDGGYRAIDNMCPHAGAPLCDGSMLDGKVVCYLHCWEFDLDTGACDVGPEWNVRTYPIREANGRLEIEWSESASASQPEVPKATPGATPGATDADGDQPPADRPGSA